MMKISPRLLIMLIAATIASLGTIPYGFQFTHILKINHAGLSLLIGIVFAASAGIANILLGLYSFIHMNKDSGKSSHTTFLKLISFVSAIPVGCTCFFAYQHLHWTISLPITAAVILINAAIAYTAISHFSYIVQNWHEIVKNRIELACRLSGFTLGILVSLTAFMASAYTFDQIFSLMTFLNGPTKAKLSLLISFITWAPFALLFANATQLAAQKSYLFFSDFSQQSKNLNAKNLFLIIFALCSGTAFAQMTLKFFSPEINAFYILNHQYFYNHVYSILSLLALVAAAAVNYYGVRNMLDLIYSFTRKN